jgi:hypothetical protein
VQRPCRSHIGRGNLSRFQKRIKLRTKSAFVHRAITAKVVEPKRRNSLESLESQNIKRDSFFKYASETKDCRACKRKSKVEDFGIWRNLPRFGKRAHARMEIKVAIRSGRREDMDH